MTHITPSSLITSESTFGTNMASSTSSTPVRNNNNNYAAPHTPITSVKRPRSSLERPGVSKAQTTPSSSMSPMHPPRPVKRDEEDVVVEVKERTQQAEETSSWVGRQVDALFSPVLSFLGTGDNKEQETDKDDDDNHVVTDEDVAMDSMETTAIEEDEQQLAVKQTWSYGEEELHHSHSHCMGDLEEQPSCSFDEEEFNPYLFIKSLPRYDLVCGKPRICLPPKAEDAPPITLVLDLDETLVHCTVDPTPDANLVFPVLFHGMEYQVHVRLRPYLFEFLERIHNQYEVVVFTASQKVYADELLNRIDPEGKYIHHRMFRESCLPVEGNFLKDLNVLGRSLSKSVLVDNSPHAFGYQVDNGIPIESWFDDPHDRELIKLEKFLKTLKGVDDVRSRVREQFQTFRKIESA